MKSLCFPRKGIFLFPFNFYPEPWLLSRQHSASSLTPCHVQDLFPARGYPESSPAPCSARLCCWGTFSWGESQKAERERNRERPDPSDVCLWSKVKALTAVSSAECCETERPHMLTHTSLESFPSLAAQGARDTVKRRERQDTVPEQDHHVLPPPSS